MDPFDVRFGRHLRALREQHRLTQNQLADRAGLHRNAISNFERAVRFPDRDSMNALAEVLGIEPLLSSAFSVREPSGPSYGSRPDAKAEIEALLDGQPEGVVRLVAEIARVVVRELPAPR